MFNTITKSIKQMKHGVKFGVIYGVVISAIMLVLYLVNKEWVVSTSLTLGLSFLIGTVLLVMTGKAAKADNGGFLPFGEALVNLVVCFVVGSLITTIFSYVLFNFIDPSLQELMKEKAVEMAESAAGMFGGEMNEDQLDEMREAMEETEVTSASQLLVGWLSNSLMGTVYCLILAAILKKDPTV